MEFDKAQLVHDAAEAIWDRRNMMGLEAPFSELPKMVQFTEKNKIMPTILFALSVVEDTVKGNLIDIINRGHENKMSAEEILLSLTMELS